MKQLLPRSDGGWKSSGGGRIAWERLSSADRVPPLSLSQPFSSPTHATSTKLLRGQDLSTTLLSNSQRQAQSRPPLSTLSRLPSLDSDPLLTLRPTPHHPINESTTACSTSPPSANLRRAPNLPSQAMTTEGGIHGQELESARLASGTGQPIPQEVKRVRTATGTRRVPSVRYPSRQRWTRC